MSEMVKREKARRVWRLNKKEGIPVLDALETVDISKDVYYRIKDEYESEWEEEILTVEQIQKELSEAREELETLENRIELAEERIEDVYSESLDIDQAVEAAQRVWEVESKLDDLRKAVKSMTPQAHQQRIQRLNSMENKVEELEELDIKRRLHDLEQDTSNNRRIAESAESEARKLKEKMVTSLWDLI